MSQSSANDANNFLFTTGFDNFFISSNSASLSAPALVEALKNGTIAGAALDVLCEEPPPKDHSLFALDNVILTPHIAAFSADFEKNFWTCSAQKIIAAGKRWESQRS